MDRSEQIWQKYKDKFRKTDYSKFQSKRFYEPINVEKEEQLISKQKEQKAFESQFPYYDELPRLSRRAIYPFKGEAKIEQFGYFGIFTGLLFGKIVAQLIYGPLITKPKIQKTRILLCGFLSTSFMLITGFAQDFQPQNSGINMIQHYDEIMHQHYDLALDAYRDQDYIKYKDQRIEKKDYNTIKEILEQKKLEIKKQELFNMV